MERDALISHGTPFLMQDRFMDCSDKSTVSIYNFCVIIIYLNKVFYDVSVS
jgi:DNA-directed RNA polymerase I subunit RPA2